MVHLSCFMAAAAAALFLKSWAHMRSTDTSRSERLRLFDIEETYSPLVWISKHAKCALSSHFQH